MQTTRGGHVPARKLAAFIAAVLLAAALLQSFKQFVSFLGGQGGASLVYVEYGAEGLRGTLCVAAGDAGAALEAFERLSRWMASVVDDGRGGYRLASLGNGTVVLEEDDPGTSSLGGSAVLILCPPAGPRAGLKLLTSPRTVTALQLSFQHFYAAAPSPGLAGFSPLYEAVLLGLDGAGRRVELRVRVHGFPRTVFELVALTTPIYAVIALCLYALLAWAARSRCFRGTGRLGDGDGGEAGLTLLLPPLFYAYTVTYTVFIASVIVKDPVLALVMSVVAVLLAAPSLTILASILASSLAQLVLHRRIRESLVNVPVLVVVVALLGVVFYVALWFVSRVQDTVLNIGYIYEEHPLRVWLSLIAVVASLLPSFASLLRGPVEGAAGEARQALVTVFAFYVSLGGLVIVPMYDPVFVAVRGATGLEAATCMLASVVLVLGYLAHLTGRLCRDCVIGYNYAVAGFLVAASVLVLFSLIVSSGPLLLASFALLLGALFGLLGCFGRGCCLLLQRVISCPD